MADDDLIAGWRRETWDSDHCPRCGEEWKDCPDPGHARDTEDEPKAL